MTSKILYSYDEDTGVFRYCKKHWNPQGDDVDGEFMGKGTHKDKVCCMCPKPKKVKSNDRGRIRA